MRCKDLSTKIEDALQTAKSEQDEMLSRLSLLGPLATAGVSAIAIQHELRKQFAWLQDLIDQLRLLDVLDMDTTKELRRVIEDLESWLHRAKATNAIFDYMTGETIEQRDRYKARAVIEDVVRQLSFLARGVEIDYDGSDPSIHLPEATYAEWVSIFQNVLTNAFNAMHESEYRCVKIETRQSKMKRAVVIQDTGVGVDLEHADELFEPFKRGLEISRRRMAMGYGGTGLGLTIVRLLCERIGCIARFAEPAEGFSTAFVIEWKEAKSRRM
ncbi:MAG TPA: sensor histidine kinase [Armatimonadetes bacterium]|nr:sensor histidine kinase [Armatimonadota bacterium]